MCVYVCELNTTTAWNYFNYPLCENAISRVDCNRMKMGKTIIQHRNIYYCSPGIATLKNFGFLLKEIYDV